MGLLAFLAGTKGSSDSPSQIWCSACMGAQAVRAPAASSAERMPKNWAEVAAALLGPVEHRSQQLTSAFSDALRGGVLAAALASCCQSVVLHTSVCAQAC